MAEFIAKIRAELDYSKIDKQKDLTATHSAKIAAEIDPNTIQTKITPNKKITIENVKAKISEFEAADGAASNLASSIQVALDKSKKPIKINNLKGTLGELDVDPASTNTIAKKINAALAKHSFAITVDHVKFSGKSINLGKSVQDSLQNSVELKMNTGVFDNQLSRAEDRFNALKEHIQKSQIGLDISADLSKVNKLKREIESSINKGEQIDNASLEEYNNTLARLNNNLSIAARESKAVASSLQVQNFDNKLSQWMLKNTKAAKVYGVQIKNLQNEFRSCGNSVPADKLKEFEARLKDIDAAATAAGIKGKSFGETFKSALLSISKYVSASEIIHQTIIAFKDMLQQVKDVDAAKINLMKVTDETDVKYTKFLEGATQSAKELGRTVSSLVEQSATWAKLGYNIDQSADLAKLSSVYANVAEVDDATAVSDIVTAMKAFNIEAENAISIIDPLNALGNKFATSAADLGSGLTKSASAMNNSSTDLYQTLAMLTGGSEITQNAGEFGNFLKVASMRIRGMTGELQELGEEVDENVDSISKVQTQILNLTSGRVNIFNDNGEFRNYYEIMKEIASVYDSLKSTDQAALSEILFGKMRGNQGAALIQAFQSGQIEKAYETALGSQGSAMAEQERWMTGMEAKIAQFQSSWQELSLTLADSNALKDIIDSGTALLNVINDLTEAVGPEGLVGALVGIGTSIGNVGELINQFRFLIILRIEYAHEAFN